jgi:hypothetical protein
LEIPEARKQGRWGKLRSATDLGESASKKATSNLPELPNTTCMVVICWMSNGKDIILSPNELQATYTDVIHQEELINFINNNGHRKEPYTLLTRSKCTLEKNKLVEEYMGLYTNGQMITDPIYGQISFNCCISNSFKLKLGHDRKIFLVEIKRATGKAIAKHVIRPAKVITSSPVKARCAEQLIVIRTLWKVLTRVEDRRERRMVGKRMILVLM